jgi:hypothetical protein
MAYGCVHDREISDSAWRGAISRDARASLLTVPGLAFTTVLLMVGTAHDTHEAFITKSDIQVGERGRQRERGGIQIHVTPEQP